MSHIKFLIDGIIEKKHSFLNESYGHLDSDNEYANSLLKPILEAQDGISPNKAKTFLRLVSYLLPYKKQLFWGSIGAIGATIASLIPAYVSGHLIDEVVRPFQEGGLS